MGVVSREMRFSVVFLVLTAAALADTSGRPTTPPGLAAGWVFTRGSVREERSRKPLELVQAKIERAGLVLDKGCAVLKDDAIGRVTGSMTLESWVRFDDLSAGWTCFICRGTPGSGTNQSYGLYVSSAGSIYFTTIANNTATQGGKVAAGAWVHIVAVVDEKALEVRLYVNGESVKTEKAREGVKDRGGTFCIGGDDKNYRHGMTGCVRSVRVFDRAMSDADVRRMSKAKP